MPGRRLKPKNAMLKRRKKLRPREISKCRFCREKTPEIDYKDLGALHKLVTNQGRQFARKRSGNCAKHQREARRALKRARFLAFMPYCG